MKVIVIHAWEVERIDPGRIPLALIRSGSGQAGHGPWEQVLI
jgi:hypothetical protein